VRRLKFIATQASGRLNSAGGGGAVFPVARSNFPQTESILGRIRRTRRRADAVVAYANRQTHLGHAALDSFMYVSPCVRRSKKSGEILGRNQQLMTHSLEPLVRFLFNFR
jgi:hypothetical protein